MYNSTTKCNTGHTFECDPSGNFGCANWIDGHRMKCAEEGPDGAAGRRGYMHWVKRPAHSDKYTLRAGVGTPADDVTHYVPGTIVNMWLTTTDYEWKYKGFFARAVDACPFSFVFLSSSSACVCVPGIYGC